MTTGYRSKPIWIYTVAGLLVLTPFIHMMGTLKQAGESAWYSPAVWWVWFRHLDLAPSVISFLLCAAGIAILAVRRWSWWLGIGVLFTVCAYNVFLIRQTFAADAFTQILATIGSVLLLILLYFSEFKRPFFNPRLRWWESERRYRVQLPVTIAATSNAPRTPVQLRDISRSGVYLESISGESVLGLPHSIVLEVNPNLHLNCEFSRPTEDGGSAYHIVNVSRHHARFLRRWLRLLSKDPTRLVR